MTALVTKDENGCQLLELSEHLIFGIGKRLIIYADYVRLRSTCKSLQSMLPKVPNHQLSQVPWLMIPNASETCCRFFSILENKIYNLEIPELRGKLLRGSSYGWILMVDGSPELTLINPLTRAQIQLPPIDTFPDVLKYRPNVPGKEYLIFRVRSHQPIPTKLKKFKTASKKYIRDSFIGKVVLSSSPTSNEYMAMAIFGEFAEVAFCKNGDKKWTLIQREGRHHELDIISHEGKFYVLYNDGGIRVGDHMTLPKMTQLVPSLTRDLFQGFRLVRMISGEFLMVDKIHQYWGTSTRGLLPSFYKTVDLEVYILNQRDLKWKKVKNIGDNIFFLGMNNSLSFSAQDIAGCKANCIYFTDDYIDGQREGIQGGHDMCVYNMEDGRVEPLPGFASDTKLVWPPPIWVFPNPV